MPDTTPSPRLPARRRLWRQLAGMGLGIGLTRLACEWAYAVPPRELRVITGLDTPSARQLLLALRHRYPHMVADASPAAFDARKGPAVHVAIGAGALQKALAAELKGPVISAMASSQAYRQVLGVDAPGYRERAYVTGVFADAPPGAQMQLIKALFTDRQTVGALLSDASAYLDRPLRAAAAQAGVNLAIERVAPSADVVRSLTRLRDADVLLAVPDSTLYTPETLRAILESTYRRAMPVIGFSAATVTAGTLATAYCALEDMAADLVQLIDETGGGTVPEARFPQHWRVAVNDSVARSLGLPIDDKVRQMGVPPAMGRPA